MGGGELTIFLLVRGKNLEVQDFLMTALNSLLQPHIQYGLVLVTPYTKCERMEYEKPLKSFTKFAWNVII